jgi:hypothetical protein
MGAIHHMRVDLMGAIHHMHVYLMESVPITRVKNGPEPCLHPHIDDGSRP